jgi:acyl dehydratase
MTFQFHRPVFAGDTISCEVMLVEMEPAEQFVHVVSRWVCRNQHAKEVMTGEARGVIRTEGIEHQRQAADLSG